MKWLISPAIFYFLLFTFAKAQNWSPCSRTCGGGTKSRKYCLWGGVCSNIYRGCNTHACVSGWGIWQPCSKSCGGGTRFKVDHCQSNSFITCPKTYGDCKTDDCPHLDKCPSRHKFRYENPSSCCKVVNEKCGVDAATAIRIVNGINATQGQWPWVAALVFNDTNVILCGGSLLNRRWLVTAGHCFDPPVDTYIILGSVTINKPASGHQIRTVEDYEIHPGYKYPQNDISLVKMNKDVEYTAYIKPICLPTGEITPLDKTCVVVGWGLTSPNDSRSFKDHLQQVKLRTLPLDACIQGYKNERDPIWKKVDQKTNICAGILDGGKDSCRGDSGGPLMCQRCSSCGWYLAGTLSFGARICADAGVPGTYMNIYNYQYWIRKYVSLSNKEYFVC